MKNISFKNFTPHIVAIVVFIAISLIYLNPLLEGKKLKQMDVVNYKGASKEISDFREKTGEEALWTNSMFSGMPAYQISVAYKGNLTKQINKIFGLGLPHPANLIFLYLIGFYILLLVLGVNPWLSIGGAIAYAFSSYFFIVLEAGHNTKALAIGYMAPVLAGIILSFRGRYLLGGMLTALFLALELKSNHLQITYYLLLIVLILGIAELVKTIQEKSYMPFLKSIGVLIIASIIALSTCTANFWATYEYGNVTMRGKSELTFDKENKTSGLDKDYATAWSYGKAESLSLMIPNVKGGGTGAIGEHKKALEDIDPQYKQMVAGSNQYWGDQPFTSGPVYAGAVAVFFFVLGLFLVRGRFKWVLLAATIVSIVFAWGKNNMGLTSFLLDYFPAYNKFRSVSMILVIAELAIPLLAILAVKEIYENPDILKEKRNQFLIALGLTGGFCLLFYLSPRIFSFLANGEYERITNQLAAQLQQNGYSGGEISQITSNFLSNLEDARVTIFKADAIRSFLFIIMGAALLWLYSIRKLGKQVFVIGIIVLFLIDMWAVDKRYLNNENFASKKQVQNPFQLTPADQTILQDKDPHFRVLNLSVSTFNDASTSYYHKSVGGYHGAKLKRYQELIDFHISKNNIKVLNMLNTKYIIQPDQNKQPMARLNYQALGNAWFVENHKIVENADEEIMALNDFDPATTVIIDKRFQEYLANYQNGKDSLANIIFTNYKPNYLAYEYKTTKDQLTVFSEIYYKHGWNAYVDGKLIPHFRANYVLRAMVVPAGQHKLEFKFEPKVYYVGESISLAGSIILILLVVGVGFIEIKKRLTAE